MTHPLITALEARGWTLDPDGALTRSGTVLRLDPTTFRVRLDLLWVAPERRGQGCGRAALADLVAAADATGTRLVLTAQPFWERRETGPDTAALCALYAAFGFLVAGPDGSGGVRMHRPPGTSNPAITD